ncbi:protein kinase domain-containing protein [Streptomyces bullii]|uniref:non-specific serine/threonine protein kinase n=1 Tax=Streptomyces bullii TaxID=349910 RepID=A0ABW0ULE0_9ACTN
MGEVFAGRYELVDPIGRGGVGAVWRAWDHRRRRYVAAKVLLQSDAHSLLRFVREQALRIDHPHVLAPTSWAADDDKVLFTMDLVAGGSLVHLVGDYGPLPPAFVCTLLDQLLAGLAAVHAEGVVHRDVKPANVLLEATGTGRPRLRLSDFGIAMRLGEPRLTETNLVVGTPGYLAPEQLMGSEPDFPADLFAVGLVALYLLEGAKPDSKALVQYFAELGTPGAPKGIPEPLWQVVATLLQPDPQARFRTATGARKALAAAAELLPEPGPDDELIEIFDQLGPLPSGFGPDGPLKRASGLAPRGEQGVPSLPGQGDPRSRSGTNTPGSRPGPHSSAGSASPQSGSVGGADPETGTGAGAGSVTGSGSAHPGAGAGSPSTDSHSGVVPPPDPRRNTHGATGADRSAATDTGTGTDRAASATPSAAVQPPAMSDTGSFHLPPPQTTVTSTPQPAPQPRRPQSHQPHDVHDVHEAHEAQGQARAQPHPTAQQQPAYVSPYDPTHPLPSPRPQGSHMPPAPPAYPAQALTPAPQQRADASTASYTAEVPQVPASSQAMPRHRTNRRRRRRTGPPAKVAIPILLLALACYAVGFWALSRI